MNEISIVGVLFLLSLVANAVITRWSTKRVLGLEVSLVKSSVIVVGRSLAAMLGGFAIGYGIKVGLLEGGEVNHKFIQLSGMAVVVVLSFVAYWVLLGKMTNTSISFWGMTKTVATETIMLVVVSVGIAIVLSVVFFTFS